MIHKSQGTDEEELADDFLPTGWKEGGDSS